MLIHFVIVIIVLVSSFICRFAQVVVSSRCLIAALLLASQCPRALSHTMLYYSPRLRMYQHLRPIRLGYSPFIGCLQYAIMWRGSIDVAIFLHEISFSTLSFCGTQKILSTLLQRG
jgi:hypothetical protein